MQLFLLHFAGGNCYSYEFLIRELKDSFKTPIDYSALELPGRGRRHEEPLLRNKRQCIDDYLYQIKKQRDKSPYIILGHSMGATLGLSIVKKMEEVNDPPLLFIASGNAGPGVLDSVEELEEFDAKKDLWDDRKFKKKLRKLGGIPEDILSNEELFQFFAPVIRADFEVLEDEQYDEQHLIINTPIFALMGEEEKNAAHINNWKNFTSANFASRILTGNHFFIHDHPFEIANLISSTFRKSVLNIT